MNKIYKNSSLKVTIPLNVDGIEYLKTEEAYGISGGFGHPEAMHAPTMAVECTSCKINAWGFYKLASHYITNALKTCMIVEHMDGSYGTYSIQGELPSNSTCYTTKKMLSKYYMDKLSPMQQHEMKKNMNDLYGFLGIAPSQREATAATALSHNAILWLKRSQNIHIRVIEGID